MEEFLGGEIWEVDDIDSIQVREVYARYGLAMFKAQLLEYTMINLLASFVLFPSSKNYSSIEIWSGVVDDFYEQRFKKTFGNLMKELAAVSVIPKGILDFLEEAKKDRDYLAHKFFRNNDLKFMTWQGRRIMLSECDEIVNKLSRIDGVIEDLVEEQCKKFGIDKELIDREFSKLLSEI